MTMIPSVDTLNDPPAYSQQRHVLRLRREAENWPVGLPVGVRRDHDARMLEWFGLRPRHPAWPCPMQLVGKQCNRRRDSLADCICHRHEATLDHSRAWIDAQDRYVQTAEPFGFDGAQITRLAEDLARIGVVLHMSGQSIYYPTECVLLAMRAAA